jgi:hypothetical protein
MSVMVIHDAMTPSQYQRKLPALLRSRSLSSGVRWFLRHRIPLPADAYFHVVENVTPSNWIVEDNIQSFIADLPVQ